KNRVVKNFAALLGREFGKVGAPQLAVLAHGLRVALKLHGATDVSAMRLVVVARKIIADRAKRRMKYGTVQALVVILHDQLPVGLHLVLDTPMRFQLSHPPSRELLRQIFQLIGQRCRPRAEVDEDVAVPDLGRNTIEGVVFAAEAVLRMRSPDEAPVESVGPAVVAALNSPREMSFAAGADAGAAMPAHVEKCPHRSTPVASNDDAFTCNLAHKKVARRWNLVGAPGADPGIAIETFELVAEKIRVGVVPRG